MAFLAVRGTKGRPVCGTRGITGVRRVSASLAVVGQGRGQENIVPRRAVFSLA